MTDLADEKLEHIEESLRHLATPIEDLKPDLRNARLHDERNLEAIADSLRRFGQQKPVVAREDGTLIAGHGTVEAAQRLGWRRIAVATSHLDGAEALAFGVADNRTTDLSQWDVDQLLKTSGQLDDLPTEAMGFNADEWGDMFNQQPFELELEDEEPGGAPSAPGPGSEGSIIHITIPGELENNLDLKEAVQGLCDRWGLQWKMRRG